MDAGVETRVDLDELASRAPHSRRRPPARSWPGRSSGSAIRWPWPPPSRTPSSSTSRSRSTRHRGGVPRHRLPLPRDARYVEDIRARYDLNLTVTKPVAGAEQWPCGTGPVLRVPQGPPLKEALAGKEAWMTGLKRVDAWTRRAAPIVSFDDDLGPGEDQPAGHLDRAGRRRVRGRPRDPRAPPLSQGYLSIGCAPTTRPVARARTPAPAAGPTRTRSSAGCTSDMRSRSTGTSSTGSTSGAPIVRCPSSIRTGPRAS